MSNRTVVLHILVAEAVAILMAFALFMAWG